jgi:DNA-binding XRE family transcriptional regulator
MNAVLAKNVKMIRNIKHWTQQHLADTAGILLRTVQRVEKGDGASLETLGALANAFDVSIDVLQTDMDVAMEQLRQVEEDFRRRHDLVDVAPVTCSAHLDIVGGSDAYLMHCECEDDAVRDAFADLESNLKDMADIWDDVDPLHHRDWVKGAYKQVEELNRLGVVISVGKAHRTMTVGGDTVQFRTLYVVAWLKGQEKSVIAIEKNSNASFAAW